ncbi:MAG: BPTD_3080 family restriction endonuclease, partial [Sciscionella sp.]
RAEYAQRTGRNADELDDSDIVREVMNTVGKQGKLGAGVRCVVSVSMLTEGWDANTVTHILGVRAFGSQLLCEQVVGRGLRRRSYAVNDEGRFEPEYAEVYGVPFSFIRVEPGDPANTTPTRAPVRVQSLDDRWQNRITVPKLDGYRVEMPDQRPALDFETEPPFYLNLDDVPTRTSTGWYVGQGAVHELDELRSVRAQEVAFRIARRMLHRYVDGDPRQQPVSASAAIHDGQDQPRRWLFPDLVAICRQWLDEVVDYAPDTFPGLFRIAELEARAAERINQAVFRSMDASEEKILPIFKRSDPEGSTDDIDFFTTKRVYETEPKKCPVNFVVLDGWDGNTWEQIVAQTLEALSEVDSYVKNDHLEFAIPYIHAGRTHRYLPDFVVRLAARADDEFVRHLIIEVSGTRKSAEMTKEKAETARNLWCAAVNNHGGWGRWGFIEITDPTTAKPEIAEAIDLLYADGPITGLPS